MCIFPQEGCKEYFFVCYWVMFEKKNINKVLKISHLKTQEDLSFLDIIEDIRDNEGECIFIRSCKDVCLILT